MIEIGIRITIKIKFKMKFYVNNNMKFKSNQMIYDNNSKKRFLTVIENQF